MSSLSKYDLRIFDPKAFTAEIRAFMKKHDMKTREFSGVMQYPYAPFRRIEQGAQGLTVKTAQKLIRIMETYPGQRRIVSSKKS